MMFPPPPAGQLNVPFGDAFAGGQQNENPNVTAWRQRQQQQRNLRFLMMCVFMLLMMEGEDPNMNDPRNYQRMKQNAKKNIIDKLFLEEDIAIERKKLDAQILEVVKMDYNYKNIMSLNKDIDMVGISERVEKRREIDTSNENEESKKEKTADDPVDEDRQMIHHYPWNASGIYTGLWSRQPYKSNIEGDTLEDMAEELTNGPSDEGMRMQMQQLKNRGRSIGVYILEDGFVMEPGNATSTPSIVPEVKIISDNEQLNKLNLIEDNILSHYSESATSKFKEEEQQKDGGKIVAQLFSNSIPGMSEISFLDGFIRLNKVSQNNILLRVRGVAVHKLGKISLISEVLPRRSVLFIDSADENVETSEQNRRKLQNELNKLNQLSSLNPPLGDLKSKEDKFMLNIRDAALDMDMFLQSQQEILRKGWKKMFETPGYESFFEDVWNSVAKTKDSYTLNRSRNLEVLDNDDESKRPHKEIDLSRMRPYPYVPDDETHRAEKTIGIYRNTPSSEQIFRDCEFEINLNISSTTSGIADFENLLLWQMEEFNAVSISREDKESIESLASALSMSKKDSKISREALASKLTGEIVSHPCKFLANVTLTSRRIDWEETKGKAINYSFCMMIASLAQIVLLLRQLLHTQAPSAATRVSLLCIGWQTLIDAQLFIIHILLCLEINLLIPAFSSVAFFELLIFGVIEMKYLSIIVRARSNTADPNSTTESVRRKVTILRVQFYIAIFLSFMLFFYIGQHYLTVYMLGLFSFWVPQIIQNIITEAKRPLHKHYIYGMTLTRLVAPLYVYGVPNNFLKEYNPKFESDVFMCQALIIWVGLQVAILLAQGKYGARFMIPARFLPPKFNYHRPIPESMLTALETASENSQKNAKINEIDISGASEGTRNRINGSSCRQNSTTIIEDPDNGPTLDCVICYSPIDIHNRKKYMLAPCEHIFHRECLEQWMDVKMECPICRTELPAL